MIACPRRSAESRSDARFSDSCAAPLTAPAVAECQRKTVTMLSCDVTPHGRVDEAEEWLGIAKWPHD